MTALLTVLIILVLTAAVGYAVVRITLPMILRYIDRSLRNDREALPAAYERPRYYVRGADGRVAMGARWPGWDGWYFFCLPDGDDVPFKMIRASVMTGLYGLEGVDDTRKLPPGLSPFHAVELLVLVPTDGSPPNAQERQNHFFHRYLPREPALSMAPDALAVTAVEACDNGAPPATARVTGSWPSYVFEFSIPAINMAFQLRYEGRRILWWADTPGVFTYFSALGSFEGELRTRISRPVRQGGDSSGADDGEQVYMIRGNGAFEHGFARKPFGFDRLWAPVRLAQRAIPRFRPVHYHYEMLAGEDGVQGGWMRATGFGVVVRNQGGMYIDGAYHQVERIRVTYFSDPEPDTVNTDSAGRSVKFYRRWRALADTSAGLLDYEGRREWPPAPVASNMLYYHFAYQGTLGNRPIAGRGYGEYLRI